jgi:uncharacterized protein with PIN domain
MIIDTSAIVAILYREPEARDFVERIHAADLCRSGVATYVELSIVVLMSVVNQFRRNGSFRGGGFRWMGCA